MHPQVNINSVKFASKCAVLRIQNRVCTCRSYAPNYLFKNPRHLRRLKGFIEHLLDTKTDR